MLDYYEALGVADSATDAEIKKAWRRVQIESHPDKNPGDKGAEDRFKLCAEAYEVLRDPHRRKMYDMSRHVGPGMSIDPSIFDEVSGENGEEIISSFVKVFGAYLDDKMPGFQRVAQYLDDYEDRLEGKRARAQAKQKSKGYRTIRQGGVTVRVPK